VTKIDAPTTSVGEHSGSLASWRLDPEAANRSPGRSVPMLMKGIFLTGKGMPTVVRNLCREHVEALIAAELERNTRRRMLLRVPAWLRAARHHSAAHAQALARLVCPRPRPARGLPAGPARP
jgi:hypothetical protein